MSDKKLALLVLTLDKHNSLGRQFRLFRFLILELQKLVITVSSIKGGVGKSSVVLLLANNLAARGRKVLVIDTDLNNTATVYYTMGIGRIGEICERQNVSLAFSQGKLDEKNIVKTRRENVYVVPSSLRLLDQRSMESMEIKRVLRSVKGFDDVIIDTSPTYDSIVAGALMAADLILSPVQFTEYNYNMSACLMSKIRSVMPEQAKKMYFLFNHWSEQYAKSPISLQNLVLTMYRQNFDNLLSVTLPNTRFVDRYTNFDEKCSIRSTQVGSERLAKGVNELINMIYDQNTIVEVF